ncbi:hypothetical protein B296_00013106 [Ensete ventricosum]|uniref:Uncharacterized protein n=1 Tax=Ensete ventricosum TaxID=4639 RepID=A0A427AST7_ENSVE|nr:hypothetical protein B296_00013106 [Ensete ventricosum]
MYQIQYISAVHRYGSAWYRSTPVIETPKCSDEKGKLAKCVQIHAQYLMARSRVRNFVPYQRTKLSSVQYGTIWAYSATHRRGLVTSDEKKTMAKKSPPRC